MEDIQMAQTVDETASPDWFKRLMDERAQLLLGAARFFETHSQHESLLTRPLLGLIYSQARQLEEFLDAYGARNNRRWHLFRQYVAATKLFADAGYKLLHIALSGNRYQLLNIQGDFSQDTEQTLLLVRQILGKSLGAILSQSRDFGLTIPEGVPDGVLCFESPSGLMLEADRKTRHITSAKNAVMHLATAFLDLAAVGNVLHLRDVGPETPLESCVPDPVNEELLRQLEYKFHNMQAHYDTYISDTDIEHLDCNLPVLRGHISIIFHLLETATLFSHFYERHQGQQGAGPSSGIENLIEPQEVLRVVFKYCIAHAGAYLEAAKTLCHIMLQRYAEIIRIEVNTPPYRGFHVRPSTMIAKIVRHYGSNVSMELFGESYDASQPLELFRANEKINALKRQRIAEKISRIPLKEVQGVDDILAEVRRVVFLLAEQNQIVIYEQPLPFEELKPYAGELLSQFIVDEITRLLAWGKIDIDMQVSVTFVGDRRVLEDIRTLAENGYGEDRFGNNIPYPETLSYLRK
jgi:hypothetical protein